MPCAAVAAASLLWLAAAPVTETPRPTIAAEAPAMGLEALFTDIVARAGRLKAMGEAMRASGAAADPGFEQGIVELAELDMAAQRRVREIGVDGDLACILRGIAEDLPVKLAALRLSSAPEDRDLALRELIYLLNDNIEVVVTPPGVTSGIPTGGVI